MSRSFNIFYQPMPSHRTTRSRSERKGCPIDGPNGWGVPTEPSHFGALGLAAPDFLWPCQESSGSLVNSIGTSLSLAATAAGHTYQQSVPGWSRKFLGMDGVTVNQGWATASALVNTGAGVSIALVALASVALPTTAATRLLMAASGANWLGITAVESWDGGLIRTSHNSNRANGTVQHHDIDQVRQFVWYRNGTADVSGAGSNLDSVAGTHAEEALTVQTHSIGVPATGNISAESRVGWFGIYLAANAEQNWPAYLAMMRGG